MGYRGMTVGATPLLPYHMEAPSFTLERSAAGGGETDLKLGPKSVILRPCRELANGRGLCPNLRPGPAPAVVGRAPRRPRNAPTDRPDLMPGASEAGPIPHRRAKFHART